MNAIFRWTAADVMQRSVIAVSPDAPVAELLNLLEEENISGVPVVDPDETVLGVVSVSDVARAASEEASTGEPPATLTVRPDASLVEVARFLDRAGVHRALVMDGSVLAGIVTTMDLVRGLARASEEA